MTIPKLATTTQFEPAFSSAKLLVVYFTATWCGPCQQISPIIDQLHSNYANVTFLKVDVDDHKEIALRFSITSIPTFLFVKGGQEIERVRGADVAKVAEEVQKLSKLDPTAERFAIEEGSSDGPAVEVSEDAKKYIPQGFSVLNDGIFIKEVEFMNVEDGNSVRAVLGKEDDIAKAQTPLNSDIDSQILLHIPLINICKIYSILIKAKEVDGFQRPNLLKTWINNNNIISFDDAISLNSLNDSEEITEWDENGWTEYKLKFVRFQKVKSLDIFLDGEDEDSQTLIEKILIVGVDGESAKQGSIPKE
jgi:thioredoxin